MTGFATAKGAADGYSWVWDIRAVNARGMDVRMRLPDWVDGLEAALRPMVQKAVGRGNVNLTLKVQRDDKSAAQHIDLGALNNALAAIKRIEIKAQDDHNLQLGGTTAAEILAMPAVRDGAGTDQDTAALLKALKKDFAGLLGAFNKMRGTEGGALHDILTGQLDQIETLTKNAASTADARRDKATQNLRKNLALVLDNSDGADPDRVAQELALIAVKSDVTEEIDRLLAHVSAARELLGETGAVGRKLDFLSQEFNREANTLCSKAQFAELTRIGLDLKAVIDQMREQVQNVE